MLNTALDLLFDRYVIALNLFIQLLVREYNPPAREDLHHPPPQWRLLCRCPFSQSFSCWLLDLPRRRVTGKTVLLPPTLHLQLPQMTRHVFRTKTIRLVVEQAGHVCQTGCAIFSKMARTITTAAHAPIARGIVNSVQAGVLPKVSKRERRASSAIRSIRGLT